ncbi:restriction endonuclease subunit S [Methylophaga thiooxydans]|uniref:Type I restriction modification DNA specificity domain protein n=1 Tax=Methylophaga thiooxydans DMS010 TaxID=637616 RepID=C0N6F0_9GAMM|nr:restriction endonuclease subunit S [Methylophaga thiooxydans]EEF79599.1 Type I restriction modification DNA specificity domain protein [Methylophaga thiooxydans DMS010]
MEQLSGKYAPYSQYETVALPWFDTKPKEWMLTRLKFTSSINMGQSPNSDDCNDEGHGRPFLQGNAEFGMRTPKAKLFCEAAKKTCSEGDVLLSVRAPVGELNIANQEYGIGRGLCAITAQSVKADFMWWLLQASVSQLRAVATGSTFQAVSAEQVSNLTCLLPAQSEQTQIATFLDRETAKIDRLIEKQQRLIKLLEEKRQAVISHAVTKGLNPDVPMKDSGVEWLGEIPSMWSIVQLRRGIDFLTDFEANGSFAEVKKNVSLDTDNKYAWYVRATDLEHRRFGLVDGNRSCNEKSYSYLSKTTLDGGELLVAKRGEIGKVYLMPEIDCRATLAPNLYLIRLNDNFFPQFTYYWFISSYGKSELVNADKSTTIGALYKDDVRACIIPMPPVQEQILIVKHISERTDKIQRLITKVQKSIALSTERRAALISAAVTGKIDVRDQVPQDVEEAVAS